MCQTDRTVSEGSVTVPCWADEHLCAALEQMDLLLASQQAETGLAHLVALLKHLRALRQAVS